MSSFVKNKLPIKPLVSKFNKLLLSSNKNFNPTTTIDPQLKLLVFITNFANVYTNNHISFTLDNLWKYNLGNNYIHWLTLSNTKKDNDEYLSRFKYIDKDYKNKIFTLTTNIKEFTKSLNSYFNDHNAIHKFELIDNLMINITKLFLINYYFTSAELYKNGDTEKNIDFNILQLKYLSNVHTLIKQILPHNNCMLIVLINNLLNKLYV